MIDGHHKVWINTFWDKLGRFLVFLGLTPNQVTLLGLFLILVNCAFYVYHRSDFWFGLILAIVFTLDALDGAVARITDSATKYGGYLDATADRYQEVAVYLVIAWVHGYWAVCFLAVTGSLSISYNKARVAVEIPVDNDNWPDLLERMERIVLIYSALILSPFVALPEDFPGDFLSNMILIIAVLAHITAIQRFFRARRILLEADRRD
ncbi:MAG: CDP-diacylglycerol--glycerol-3-phosphate 3-phosphatidyltransferase/archaetidylinositol phosphate synthase [Candidatus Kentron sp. G]|nr:MAG: CDP-diacylglycerol--glycerol-3-phosphate 3-phosphatidyltransferase/archaetidylinositol phosphate synthase [Candidatus Kentron sp. G]VFN02763.1 MAG: CDP-diacylglycerol--glycerol-3-phosphate 3-phosphatidyltransferase/archaetidylinositol phosphate synthase [Candidatus Kentron sp. G]VFN04382.1 MAG: CDP-diacylglycerol--glycerol-3-phosphate 3-phosphatidyltransferase/archaetidylinositol phosphate synthase [Candidatus Kentron sp. G]